MSRWSKIYRDQIDAAPSLDAFFDSRITYKRKLIDTIGRWNSMNKKVIEVGCGSGITTTFLGLKGYDAAGIDADPDMIDLARSIAARKESAVSFAVDDIMSLRTIRDRCGVIFSNGVMEHFQDDEIISSVNIQLSKSECVIISVPSDYFLDNQKIFGNERFMSVEKWKAILSRTKGILQEEFNFDSDPVIGAKKPQFIGFVMKSL